MLESLRLEAYEVVNDMREFGLAGPCFLIGALLAPWLAASCQGKGKDGVAAETDAGRDVRLPQDSSRTQDLGDAPPDSQGADEPFMRQGGTRLKARWYETPEGTRLPASFYDSQLGVECGFSETVDDNIRCVPYGAYLGSTFADSSCTVPAVVLSHAECQPAEFVRRFDFSDPCVIRTRSYRRGDPLTTVYAQTSTTSATTECTAVPIPTTSKAFRLGGEVLLSSLVKLTTVRLSGQNPVPVMDFKIGEAEDGALVEWGWTNTITDTPCSTYSLAPTGDYRCLPPMASIGGFSDAACSQPAARFSSACKPTPQYAVETDDANACPQLGKVRKLGPRLEIVFSKTTTACGAVATGTSTYQYSSLLEAVAPEVFPAFPILTAEGGSGRLRRRLLGPPTGRRIVAYGMFDTVRNEACYAKVFGQGKARCVPSSSSFGDYYADAGCREPLWRQAPGSCPPTHVSVDDFSECPPRPRIYAVRAAYTGPVYRPVAVAVGTTVKDECQALQTKVQGESFNTLVALAEDSFPELTMHDSAP